MTPKVAAFIWVGLMTGIATSKTWVESLGVVLAIVGVFSVVPTAKARGLPARLRPFVYFALLTLLFGGLGSEEPLWTIGPLTWGSVALQRAGVAAIRLITLGAAVTWLTFHVDTTAMVSAVARMGDWGRKVGVNVTPLLLGFAIALRFLPMMQQEAAVLRVGWDARGANLFKGPVGKIRYTMGLAIPLLAAALRRAEYFALALELRTSLAGSTDFAAGLEPKTLKPERPMEAEKSPWRIASALAVAWMPVAAKVVNAVGVGW